MFLENVFNHLVLPPKLPGHEDADIHGTSVELLTRLIHATSTLARLAELEKSTNWGSLRDCLHRCLDFQNGVEKKKLLNELRCLKINHLLVVPTRV